MRGKRGGEATTVSMQRMEKVLHQSHIGFLTQLKRLHIKELVAIEDPKFPPLLAEFLEVFAESKGALQANHVSDGTCDMLRNPFAYD
ncbi:hypothetical protein B296_00018997 [Ensete ventricosum]|uniref:Uncharacterized protein n=1 Tax=Ensete ventricosum TaxID=4639 RepID=A0A427AY71_ENSVE|nr:hypothetical protein B296_00018997 [Ensete ventricosum]